MFCHRKCGVHDMTMIFSRGENGDVQSLSECFPDIFGSFLSIFWYFEVGVYNTKKRRFWPQKNTKIAKKSVFFACSVIESAVIMIWPCFFYEMQEGMFSHSLNVFSTFWDRFEHFSVFWSWGEKYKNVGFDPKKPLKLQKKVIFNIFCHRKHCTPDMTVFF